MIGARDSTALGSVLGQGEGHAKDENQSWGCKAL